ncbi:MAG TPA: glycerol-3-phosphate dehydrogenase/oxidase [Polyangia bacterium]|nr:glycerol-3-phosphate dehydrogenase/oxidase [Polyangia bacterium]
MSAWTELGFAERSPSREGAGTLPGFPDSRGDARAATLGRLADETFDLLVVGGGATGAAIARDAALRGVGVALVDAGDFAGQTSSHSSKLIHGGLRYLQYGDLPLVFEGLRERHRLMATAPHLCRPIEFVFPGYHGESPGLFTLGAGIALYNALALWQPPAASRHLDAHALYALSPHLRSAGLQGAAVYVDCQTDDARLVLENVLDAEAAGAACANHLRVLEIARDRRGRARGARVVDGETGARFEIRARLVVSATGPFTDGFLDGTRRLRPTLGVHLVFDAARVPHGGRALVLRTPQDNRLYFVLPAGTRTIVGTTDTDFAPAEDPTRAPRIGDEIRARGADVAYLLEAARHAFPSLGLGPEDVVSTFAGLRPLLAGNAHTPSETSREHEIARSPDGLVVVAGGKLTTLRRMAQETTDVVVETLRASGLERAFAPCATRDRPLPGGGPLPEALAAGELAPDLSVRLGTYGSRAGALLALAAASPPLGERIDPALPYLWAEVVHAARHEQARDLSDVLVRRLPLFRDAADQGVSAAPRAASLVSDELGWDEHRRARAVADYQASVRLSRRWQAEL